MANLKTLVLGAGLGLAGLVPKVAEGQDTSEYAEMSRPAITKELKERAVVLNENNFKREVFDYPGAVMVLFDSTCNRTQEADNIDRNMGIVYLRLLDKFDSKVVNEQDLKFAYFDGCGVYAKPNGFFTQIGVTSTETHMYLDGRKIDILRGGPVHEASIPEWYNFLSTQWIPTNLTDPNREYVWKFNGTAQEQKVAALP